MVRGPGAQGAGDRHLLPAACGIPAVRPGRTGGTGPGEGGVRTPEEEGEPERRPALREGGIRHGGRRGGGGEERLEGLGPVLGGVPVRRLLRGQHGPGGPGGGDHPDQQGTVGDRGELPDQEGRVQGTARLPLAGGPDQGTFPRLLPRPRRPPRHRAEAGPEGVPFHGPGDHLVPAGMQRRGQGLLLRGRHGREGDRRARGRLRAQGELCRAGEEAGPLPPVGFQEAGFPAAGKGKRIKTGNGGIYHIPQDLKRPEKALGNGLSGLFQSTEVSNSEIYRYS